MNVGAPDNFTQGRFSGNFDCGLGIANVEQILERIGNLPLNRQINIDNILIAREHQAFFGDVTTLAPIARARPAKADIDLMDGRDFGAQDRFNRVGQMPVQARIGDLDHFAKAHDDALLVGLDTINARGQPHQKHQHPNPDQSLGAKAAGQGVFHSLLSHADNVFDIWRAWPAAAITAIATMSTAPRAAASFIVPRHI